MVKHIFSILEAEYCRGEQSRAVLSRGEEERAGNRVAGSNGSSGDSTIIVPIIIIIILIIVIVIATVTVTVIIIIIIVTWERILHDS